ncbi:hypothetical protein [Azospirillum canadense]|uniref:hypothetical protein n=1 Tax=Azospirillum canadense TaxID=403962 RepID=UPI0022272278|nr:hypothetical protein [Azospirillum canadense]MCW2242767.1 hypothetical protein [Azospirillum canadense]
MTLRPLNTVTSHDTWTFHPFLIDTNQGPMGVDHGKARRAFGIHRSDAGWNLTHLPTGALIGVAPSLDDAMRAADGIEGAWDWSVVGVPAAAELAVIKEALRSYGVEHPADRPAWKPTLELAA